MRTAYSRLSLYKLILPLIAIAACNNAGANLVAPALSSGFIQVAVYFDRDDSHSPSLLDTNLVGVRVALLAPNGIDTLKTAFTGATGVAHFDSLPVGTYRVALDRHSLTDTIGVVAGEGEVRVTHDSLSKVLQVRTGYTEVTLAAARALPPGKRVVIRAIVTSPLQFFHDSAAFLIDSSGWLRSTGSRPRSGNGNNIGDSVVVLGTTGQQAGQGVLVNGLFVGVISSNLAPLPRVTTIPDAISAAGGTLDAAFIQITNFVIRDTLASGTDFIVHIADPADPNTKLTMVIDQLLPASHTAFPPGRTGLVRGVLIPVGDGTWLLKPRSGFDLILN